MHSLEIMNTQCNLVTAAEDIPFPVVQATYISANDSDYVPDLEDAEDLSDTVSMMSDIGHMLSYDSHVTSFKSIAEHEMKWR
eukprot:6775700-Ditylum_brightwellii.AAC.1